MAQRPATVLDPAKIDLLRKALTVAPMTLDLTGLSMFPSIRMGDRCRVMAVDPDLIRVGEIILSTRDERLYAHRVVGITPGPPKLWTVKGDTLLKPDPPVRGEDILGQVIGVERRGRFIDLRSPARRAMGAAMAGLSAPYSRLFVQGVMLRRRVLAKMACLPAWRAKRRAANPSIVVRPATDDDVQGIAMLFGEQMALSRPMDTIDMQVIGRQARQMIGAARGAGATVWVAEHEGFVSGHAVVGPLREEGLDAPGWWVMSVYVKMTARGCGLAEALVRDGIEDARRNGQTVIRYAAYETNRPSLNLAAKLGFTPEDSDIARRFADFYMRFDSTGAQLIVTKKEIA